MAGSRIAILDPLRFENLVDLGHGEGCIGSKTDARDLASIALHDRVEHILPAVGIVPLDVEIGEAALLALSR